ncbi:MAG: hypothetical protein KC425_10575 [Anaerolineales bacterium]|nr:hypothetical protein [Anaerolineales bacterium]
MIDATTKRVVNVIVADPADVPFRGTIFVAIPDDIAAVLHRHSYDNGWVPDADYVAELEAAAAATEAAETEGLDFE